jgi:hypothetical protein
MPPTHNSLRDCHVLGVGISVVLDNKKLLYKWKNMFDNITVTNIIFYKTNLTYKQARGLFIFYNKYIFKLVQKFKTYLFLYF